jgi:hypothetical protein
VDGLDEFPRLDVDGFPTLDVDGLDEFPTLDVDAFDEFPTLDVGGLDVSSNDRRPVRPPHELATRAMATLPKIEACDRHDRRVPIGREYACRRALARRA